MSAAIFCVNHVAERFSNYHCSTQMNGIAVVCRASFDVHGKQSDPDRAFNNLGHIESIINDASLRDRFVSSDSRAGHFGYSQTKSGN